MQYLRRLYRRLLAWRRARTTPELDVAVPDFLVYEPSIARDVTSRGVRFYSLCGCCGARLHSSATLCDECAQMRETRWRQ